MKREKFYVRLKSKDYHYEQGDSQIVFLLNNKPYSINIKNIMFWSADEKEENTEFLIKFNKTEYNKFRKEVQLYLPPRVVHGTESIPPKLAVPPRHPTDIVESFAFM